MISASLNIKPYRATDCVHGFDARLCGMTFTFRTDCETFLAAIRRLFLGRAFDALPDAVPEFTCTCATRCAAPWTMAIETPGVLHLVRPHSSLEHVLLFDEWQAGAYRNVGETRIANETADTPTDARAQLLVAYVQQRLLRTLINYRPRADIGILHAAALEHGGRGLLILGDSRSGKTTLALAGAVSGWRYLAEDDVVIAREQGVILPFPLPLRLRECIVTASPRLTALPHTATTDLSGERRWLLDPEHLPVPPSEPPAPLTHIVRLRGLERRPRLEPATVFDMARDCALADRFRDEGEGLAALWCWSALTQKARLADLWPGDPDETLKLLNAWMAS